MLVDLPGIYSLSPYTSEEVVTRDFILKENPDGHHQHRRRHQHRAQPLPDAAADGAAHPHGHRPEHDGRGAGLGRLHRRAKALERRWGCRWCPSPPAKTRVWPSWLRRVWQGRPRAPLPPEQLDFCTGEVHKAIHAIAHIVEDQAEAAGYPLRFAATKLVEGDKPSTEALGVTRRSEYHIVQHIVHQMERQPGHRPGGRPGGHAVQLHRKALRRLRHQGRGDPRAAPL